MSEIASKGQLRAAYLRWAVVTVPFILLLGFTSARLAPTGAENPWFLQLAMPKAMPPFWAFGLAWTILYAMMGLALAMIINARGSRLRVPAIVLFAVQLAFNLAWSPMFFGMHLVYLALLNIGLIFVLALATTILFSRIRTGAALLMLPYLAWLGFAGYLNYEFHRLNPNAESIVPSRATDQIVL